MKEAARWWSYGMALSRLWASASPISATVAPVSILVGMGWVVSCWRYASRGLALEAAEEIRDDEPPHGSCGSDGSWSKAWWCCIEEVS